MDLYLRIALELHLKRLIVGGMEKYMKLVVSSVMKESIPLITQNLQC